jgi:hypothetical protein
MDDTRWLREKNWKNAARNKDGWRKLLKKAWAQLGCCANDYIYITVKQKCNCFYLGATHLVTFSDFTTYFTDVLTT